MLRHKHIYDAHARWNKHLYDTEKTSLNDGIWQLRLCIGFYDTNNMFLLVRNLLCQPKVIESCYHCYRIMHMTFLCSNVSIYMIRKYKQRNYFFYSQDPYNYRNKHTNKTQKFAFMHKIFKIYEKTISILGNNSGNKKS